MQKKKKKEKQDRMTKIQNEKKKENLVDSIGGNIFPILYIYRTVF